MAFPSSPADGQIYEGYKYIASIGAWRWKDKINDDAATLLDRTNHTGTQLLSTISDAGTAASIDIIVSTDEPVDVQWNNGDIWLQYED